MIHAAFEFAILLPQPPEQPYIKIVVYLSGYSFKGIPRIRIIEKKFTIKQALTEGPVLAWWQTPGIGVEKKASDRSIICFNILVTMYGYGISQWSEKALEVDFQLLAIGSYSPRAKIIGARGI